VEDGAIINHPESSEIKAQKGKAAGVSFADSLAEFTQVLGRRMMKHDCPGLAAEMCYNWMISLLPLVIFIFTLFGLMNAQPELFAQVVRVLQRLIPGQAFSLVESSIRALIEDSNSGLALLSLLASLWSASNGAVTLEKAFIRFYGMEANAPGFWRKRALALLLILGLAFMVMVCANLVIFGEVIIQILEKGLNLPVTAINFIYWVRWALPISSLLLISWFVYSVVPSPLGRQSWKKMWPGALVFVPLWILFSLLFSQYVNNMGHYSKVYGPMGAIIILMIWLYLTSFALLVGGEVNALLLERSKPKPPHFAPQL
jgi:membrane protein